MESPTLTNLRTEIVIDSAAFERLAPEWRKLAAASRFATVFQTYEWTAAWWRHFGRGRRLRLVVVREAAGALAGIFPLMLSRWYGTPLRRLSLIGTGGTDYLDIIVDDTRLADVVDAAMAALENDRSWHVLDLQQLRDGGALRSAQRPAIVRRVSAGEACPYVPLPADWAEFLKSLGKKTRANVGYYERNLGRLFEAEVGYVQDPDRLDAEMTALFELHQRRWNKRWLPGVFGAPVVQRFHRDLAKALLDSGHLRLFTIRLDGETQAVLYCFSYGDRFSYYQGGFEPTFARHSLGTVATAAALREAIAEGKGVFDFLRGDEPYKSKWTSHHVNNERWLGWRPGFLGLWVRAIHSTEERIESAAKRAARKLR